MPLSPAGAREAREQKASEAFKPIEQKIDKHLIEGNWTDLGELYINTTNWDKDIIDHVIKVYTQAGWQVTHNTDRDGPALVFKERKPYR